MASQSVYDSDEEPPPEDSCDKYLWRLDPVESHADFVIEIAATEHGETTKVNVYHVHKSVLSLGPRRSEYFAKLLQGRVFSETSRGVCRILLHPVAANAFPALLDFLYGAPQLECKTETAASLHFMGQYFEIRRLRWQARQFWMSDLSLDNCATYYQHACLFHDERILRRVQITLGSELITEISVESSILQIMDPQFLLDVVQTADLVVQDKTSLSVHASKLIAQVLVNHVDLDSEDEDDDSSTRWCIDPELFQQLTECSYLPDIDSSVALVLLKLERKIVDPPDDALTSLQQRCLESMSRDWQLIKLGSGFLETLREVSSPVFLTELLAQTMAHAKETVSTQRAKIISTEAQNSNLTMSLRVAEREAAGLESQLRQTSMAAQKWRAAYEASLLRIRKLEDDMERLRALPSAEPLSRSPSLENVPNGSPLGNEESLL